MPIKKITVDEGDKSQEVFIAMTPEEANDRSYVSDLVEGTVEKTKDQLKKKLPREKSKLSKQDQVESIKDVKKFNDAKKSRLGRPKYFTVG